MRRTSVSSPLGAGLRRHGVSLIVPWSMFRECPGGRKAGAASNQQWGKEEGWKAAVELEQIRG